MAVRAREERLQTEEEGRSLARSMLCRLRAGEVSLLPTLQDAAEEGVQQVLSVRAEHRAGEAGREGVQSSQALRLDLLTRCLEHLQERP